MRNYHSFVVRSEVELQSNNTSLALVRPGLGQQVEAAEEGRLYRPGRLRAISYRGTIVMEGLDL